MNLELDYVCLSTLIDALVDIKQKTGDKFIGFEDDNSYKTKCKLKITEDGYLIFNLSR